MPAGYRSLSMAIRITIVPPSDVVSSVSRASSLYFNLFFFSSFSTERRTIAPMIDHASVILSLSSRFTLKPISV